VGVVAGEPFGVAGLEVAGHWALAFDVAADVEIGNGHEQVWADVMVQGDDSAGLEFEFGDADAVFDEENLLRTAVEDVEGTIFVPISGGVAKRFVLDDFDGDIAKGLIGKIARDVGEGGGRETGFAVLELDGDGSLVFNGVDHFGVAESDVDVVVAMPVHQRVGVWWDLDIEDADGFIFESKVVVRLGGDFDFGRGGLNGE